MDSGFDKQDTLPNLTFEDDSNPYPSKIGPYKIDNLFSKGGMSYLFLGVHPDTSKPLIVKVLSPKFSQKKEVVDRFLKEAKIISLTNHPNIIKLFGQGRWESGLYIAMEFVKGISLRQFIEKRALSVKKAIDIILQVAYALCHLHTHGVIHRDLKPENILITESGEIKVIDFGIAQLIKERPSDEKKVIGTPAYMSPEQKIDPENISINSDIYSLGIIIYELLIGRISHGVVQTSILPSGLRPIVEKALEKNPIKRYQNAVELITDLSEYNRQKKEPEDDLSKLLDSFQEMLLPNNLPSWPHLEIGACKKLGSIPTGLYLDFFSLSQKYLIILAESIKPGMDSLGHTSILRGMIKAKISHLFSGECNLIGFLDSLNQELLKDHLKTSFTLSALMLSFEKSQFLFASSGNSIFKLPASSNKIHLLTTPNPPLGSDTNAMFVETSGNWNVGDKLVMPSSLFKEESSLLKKIIPKTLIFPTKLQPKKCMEAVDISGKRPSLILSMERLF